MDSILLIVLFAIPAIMMFIVFCITAYKERKIHGGLVNIGVWGLSAIIAFTGFGLAFREKATINDIIMVDKINITEIGVDCIIIPKTDIQKLEIEFDFLDINERKIYELRKSVGNVKKGLTYTITVSIFEIKSSTMPISCEIQVSKGYINGFTTLFDFIEKNDNYFN